MKIPPAAQLHQYIDLLTLFFGKKVATSVVIQMSDGARNALAGYLYQILGGAGLAARAVELSGEDQGELLFTLIIEARNARVFHEVYGEDLLLLHEHADSNSAIAVQFKFSRNGTLNVITAAELREILVAFHRCERIASSEFPITAFALVTNRNLHESVRKYHSQRGTPYDSLQPAGRKWLNVPPRQRERIAGEFGSVDAAARAWYEVFQRLSFYPRVGADHWVRALREYAAARGVYNDEFDPAVARLVGDALGMTQRGPAEFSRAWLNRCLIGLPGARSLQLSAPVDDSARQAAAEMVTHWLAEICGTPEHTIVRRDYLDEIGEQLTQHSIVLVLGGGGCGKSTLAAHFLIGLAPCQFVAVVSAKDLHPHWLGQQFNSWRDPLTGRQSSAMQDDDVPRRLRHANSDGPRPILILDIDGYDERGEHIRQEIQALVRLCRGPGIEHTADMAIILTLRANATDSNREKRKLINDLLSTEYPSDCEGLFGIVVVDDFTEAEFFTVLQHADVAIRNRLQAAIGTPSVPSLDTTLAGLTMPLIALPAQPDIAKSLRHPVLWGVFSRLPLGTQHQVLDGEPAGLVCLTESLVERFCMKVERRRPTLQSERVRRALVGIARSHHTEHFPARRQENWVAYATPILNQDEAVFLFDDAVSYGMIREEGPGLWAWRHRFLRASLSSQQE